MKETVYKIIDWFTRGNGLRRKINGYSVRLPTRYINYFPSDYEAANFHFLKQYLRKGDTVLDIGAHIGVFSSAAAILTGEKGKVYAFEPSKQTFDLLQKTISINKSGNVVEGVHAAIGGYTGKINFFVSSIAGDNSNSIVAYKEDRELFPAEVDIFTIDDFVAAHKIEQIKYMKIDVEGAELDALKGARYVLKRMQPFIILAIHPEAIAAKGDSLKNIYDLITNASYMITYNGKEVDEERFCSNKQLEDYHLLPVKSFSSKRS
jgi:FkbM family methyltransferase